MNPSASHNANDGLICEEYTMMEEIGRGSYATVYRGLSRRQSQKQVAIKVIKIDGLRGKLHDNLSSEVSILKDIAKENHPHMVNMLNSEKTVEKAYLVFEWCSLGDLAGYIKKRMARKGGQVVSLNTLRHSFESQKMEIMGGEWGGLHPLFVSLYMGQISEALHFLRQKSLMHRDLKPQNMLLSTPNPTSGVFSVQETSLGFDYLVNCASHPIVYACLTLLPRLKLADFGFAKYTDNKMAETLCGSPMYMAPEILRLQKYDSRADLWSVGTIFYELLFGTVPYKASNHVELLHKIDKEQSLRLPKDAVAQDELKITEMDEMDSNVFKRRFISGYEITLLNSLLKSNPKDRMDMQKFFEHRVIVASRELNQQLQQFLKSKSMPPPSDPIPISLRQSQRPCSLPSTFESKVLSKTNSDMKEKKLSNDYILVSKDSIEVNTISDQLNLYSFKSRSSFSLPLEGKGSFLKMFSKILTPTKQVTPFNFSWFPTFDSLNLDPVSAGIVAQLQGFARKAWAVSRLLDSNPKMFMEICAIVLRILFKAIRCVKGFIDTNSIYANRIRPVAGVVDYIRNFYNHVLDQLENQQETSDSCLNPHKFILEHAIKLTADSSQHQCALYMFEALLIPVDDDAPDSDFHTLHQLSEEDQITATIHITNLRNTLSL